jgi:hypothetical protein
MNSILNSQLAQARAADLRRPAPQLPTLIERLRARRAQRAAA